MKYCRKTDLSEIYNLYAEGKDWGREELDMSAPRRQVNSTLGYAPGQVPRGTQTDGRENLGANEMHMMIKQVWAEGRDDNKVTAVLVYGESGIGKTEVAELASLEISNSEGRSFVKLQEIGTPNHPTREQIMQSPEKFFVFLDISTTEMEPSDFQGLPSVGDQGKYTKLRPMEWVEYLIEEPRLAGVLFLDEIGHARADVKNVMFRVIQQRRIGNNVISPNFMIVAATNLPDPLSGSEPLPTPLLSRFKVGQLIPDHKEWSIWARKVGIHEFVIQFANAEPDKNFYIGPAETESQTYPSPRTITAFGRWLTKHQQWINLWIDTHDADVEQPQYPPGMVNSMQQGVVPWLRRVGEDHAVDYPAFWKQAYKNARMEVGYEWGDGFQTFVETIETTKLEPILDDPAKLQQEDVTAYDFLILTYKIAEDIDNTFRKITKGNIKSTDEAFDWSDQNLTYQIGDPPTHGRLNKIARLLLPEYTSDDQRATIFLQLHNRSRIAGVLFHQYLIWADLGDPDLKIAVVGDQFADALEQAKSLLANQDRDAIEDVLEQIDQIEFPPDAVAEILNKISAVYDSVKKA